MSSCRNQDETRERIRERDRGGKEGLKRKLGLGRGFDFAMQSIFWNNLFAGKTLLKQGKKYLASLNKNMIFWIISIPKIH